MAEGAPPWFLGILRSADARLRDLSRKLRRTLRIVRTLVVLMVLLDILIVAAAVLVVWRPEYTPYVTAFLLGVLLIPMIAMTFLMALPLRLKSVTRLIDKGYPGNARELALRAMARKFRDESIETEELLAEALWNEAKKIVRRRDAQATAAAAAAGAEAAEAVRAAEAARARQAAHEARDASDPADRSPYGP